MLGSQKTTTNSPPQTSEQKSGRQREQDWRGGRIARWHSKSMNMLRILHIEERGLHEPGGAGTGVREGSPGLVESQSKKAPPAFFVARIKKQ